jgi:hypothetical protein
MNTTILQAALVVVFLFGLVKAGVPGNITSFIVNDGNENDILVEPGSTVSFRCRVSYDSSLNGPLVYFKKYPIPVDDDTTLATRDEPNINIQFRGRFTATSINTGHPGIDEFEFTFTNVEVGDSANYTCSTRSNSSGFISVNVSVEPTNIGFYVDNEWLQINGTRNFKKTLILGQSYVLACNASGGNPFPNMSLSTSLGNQYTFTKDINWTYREDIDHNNFPGPLWRSRTVNTYFWMSKEYIGARVTCGAGAVNATTVTASFIAVADNASPQFNCSDTIFYDREKTTLSLTCGLYAVNLTEYFVEYINEDSTIGFVNSSTTGETRYSLHLTHPQEDDDVWSVMTLDIDDPQNFANLTKTQYKFIARNTKGQTVHSISVQYKIPVSGSCQSVMSLMLTTIVLFITSVLIGHQQ